MVQKWTIHNGAIAPFKSISIFLNGQELNRPGLKGERIVDNSFLVLFNDYHDPVDFEIPYPLRAMEWQLKINTQHAHLIENGPLYAGNSKVAVVERSIILLQRLE